MAVVNGSNGNDNLVGTLGNDTINAFMRLAPGSDTVDGLDGLDTLIVDASAETDDVQLFSGGSPTFQVRSNTGNFYVDAYNMERVRFTGGLANDWIHTGTHGGTVNGGAGTDFWIADLAAITSNITFKLGTTTAIAAAALTSILNIERIDLTTGSGNDTVQGGLLADRIATGVGNDTIDAMTVIAGGAGDVVDGGIGIDTLIVNAGAETDGVQLFAGGSPTFQVRSNTGNFYVDAYNMDRVQFTGGSAGDLIHTGTFGGSVDGGAGSDSWIADLGAVKTSITFQLGTTTAITAGGLTSILGIERIDLTTGAGNDVITGQFLADRIATGGGNDTIDAMTVIAGGPGDVVDGGIGTDTLVVNAAAETGGVQLSSGGSPTFQVRSHSGNFYVDAYNMERIQITGGSGADVLHTGTHGGSVDGGGGSDFWIADLGAVKTNIVFKLGTTTAIAGAVLTSILNIERIDLTTGSGNDTVSGLSLADRIVTAAGNDTIDAGARVAGTNSIDVVDGGLDTDTLVVNAAAETQGLQLFAGGSPTFQVRSNSGNFHVDAYNMERVKFTGGSGNDQIQTGIHGGTVDGGGGTDLWIANLGAVTSAIVFKLGTTTSIAPAALTSILNIERIDLTTGSGGDTVSGQSLADRITTGAGNDTIDAGMRLPGSNAIDVVDGGLDSDTLIVNAAAETQGVQLFAGGSPTFQVRSNSGNFHIDAYNMERVLFTAGAGNDILNGGNGDDTLVAGAGNDVLSGGVGADALTGGLGLDRFVFGFITDSPPGAGLGDLIADFAGAGAAIGDLIDLSGIDADAVLGGNQAFTWIGSAGFSGVNATGELRYDAGVLQGSTNADGLAEFEIRLTGAPALFVGGVGGDIIL